MLYGEKRQVHVEHVYTLLQGKLCVSGLLSRSSTPLSEIRDVSHLLD